MPSYFFPCVGLLPDFSEESIRVGDFTIHKRAWKTTPFDLATLQATHDLQISWHLMALFLELTNCEIEVICASEDIAQNKLDLLQAMMYVNCSAQFVAPFFTSHSANEYSGINGRDSELLIKKLPEALRNGITSGSAKVQAWPHKPNLGVTQIFGSREIDKTTFSGSVEDCTRWQELERKSKQLKTVRRALLTAPSIADVSSSLLHLWQGIESLFPDVTAELTFRLALLISQLAAGLEPPSVTHKKVKLAYKIRSAAAHGDIEKVSMKHLKDGWLLLILCMRSVLARGFLPTDDELMAEILGNTTGRDA